MLYYHIMTICKTCFIQFVPTKDRTVFCTHKCQAKWAIKLANAARKPRKKAGSYLNCLSCKKEFYVPKYRLNKECTKYCSRNCLAKDKLSKYVPIHGFKSLGKSHHKYKTITINGKQIREHRHIMEQHLGRKLERWEHVHHINDDSSDNRLENLEVLSNSDHQRKEYQFRKKFISSS
ncbi:MAG: HNH endonuclease signature motif containing protein [Gaiellaceae bacterium]